MQAMRNALNTRGLDVRAQTQKEVDDEKQRIARESSLKFRKGGLSRKERKKLKKDRAIVSIEKRKLLNPLKKRRIALVKRFMNGCYTKSPKKMNSNGTRGNQTDFERLLNSRSSSRSSTSTSTDDSNFVVTIKKKTNTNTTVEPLRPATSSAIFLPKRISPSKMTRGSRASLLPLGLSRLKSRNMLRDSAILLPSELLSLEERKTTEQILEEKLEKLLMTDGNEGTEGDEAAVAAIVPAYLLPPPLTEEEEKELMLASLGNGQEDEDEEEGEKEMVKMTEEQRSIAEAKKLAIKKLNQQSDRTKRTLHVGFSPGFKAMTEPWSQTVFSLELPRVIGPRGNGAMQI